MSILTENWHAWFIGDVDSESRLRFLKFRPQNLFLGKFGSKNSKLWKLVHIESQGCWFQIQIYIFEIPTPKFIGFQIHFWANLGPKIQSCLFCLKIGARSISRMLIPNPDLDFWNFDPKIHLWANLGQKIRSCSFCLKIGTHGISMISYSNISFLNFKSQFPFWASLGQKSQHFSFCLKVRIHGISRILILILTFVFLISN